MQRVTVYVDEILAEGCLFVPEEVVRFWHRHPIRSSRDDSSTPTRGRAGASGLGGLSSTGTRRRSRSSARGCCLPRPLPVQHRKLSDHGSNFCRHECV